MIFSMITSTLKSKRLWMSRKALILIGLSVVASVSTFYAGRQLVAPSGSPPVTADPRWSQACAYYVYLNVSTPIAHPGNGGADIIGTPGEDVGTFVNPLIVSNVKLCFEGGNFVSTTSWSVNVNNVTIE